MTQLLMPRQKLQREFALDPNLALYLPLYELDGASFMSRDRFGHLCTVIGATWGIQGRKFDGVANRITLPPAVYQRFASTDDFTILIWLNHTTNANFAALLAFTAPAVWRPLIMIEHTNINKISCILRQTADVTQNKATSTGTPLGWIQVGMTHKASDNNRVTLFLNGLWESSDNTNALTFAKTDFTQGLIGALSPTVNTFYNTIGEVLISDRLLNPGEIQRNYLATKWRYH